MRRRTSFRASFKCICVSSMRLTCRDFKAVKKKGGDPIIHKARRVNKPLGKLFISRLFHQDVTKTFKFSNRLFRFLSTRYNSMSCSIGTLIGSEYGTSWSKLNITKKTISISLTKSKAFYGAKIDSYVKEYDKKQGNI